MRFIVTGFFLFFISASCFAQILKAQQLAAPDQRLIIEKQLQKANPMIQVVRVSPADIGGLYEVEVSGGQVFLSTVDGSYLIDGRLLRVEEGSFVDVLDEKQQPRRAQLLASVKMDEFIRFPPKGEVKGVLNVFTDVDCGFCQKLHHEMGELNALGIEVRYLAFPRAGENSNSWNKVVSAWCSEDKQEAMNKLKARQHLPMNLCDDNPVKEQFELGLKMGVQGTPAIFLENGELISGYRPAPEFARLLGIAPQ